jgi:hypothetical protein
MVGWVIGDVDEALAALIRQALNGSDVEVVLEAPTREWAARRSGPTVNLYLYDIREDLRRRVGGIAENRDANGRVTSRRLPVRWFKLSYLLTAWTQRAQDEHRLLSTLLACLLRHDHLPGHLLTGPLAATGQAIPVGVGLPPPEDRSFADVWSAMGGELKPSLDVVVTAPVSPGQPWPAAAPVTAPPVLVARGTNDWPTSERRTHHRPAASGSAAPPPISNPDEAARRQPRRAKGKLADG